ncbi:MAG: YicC/YloC family endoribonuclease [Pseudomonadota bacterium]
MGSKVMSMTGFAATQGSVEGWSWTADIRAVNGRSLDLRFRVPDVDGLEPEFRKRLQARLGRGNVTVQMKLSRDEATATFALNDSALAQAVETLQQVAEAAGAAGLATTPVSPADIATMRGVMEQVDTAAAEISALKAPILASLDTCLDAFLADRAREGAALAAVISEQISEIARLTKAAEDTLGDREAAQKAAMERALAKLLDGGDMPDEARLTQELALIAVKTDVAEELDRLRAHIDAAHDLLATEGPVGRKLDFLMQEFNREANTLCSKAQSSALTTIGLDLKTVIDQMREQVQNIE